MSILKKPLSEAKLQANRANALRSTGPRTAEGRRRSALNAVTHGLTSKDITALGEDRNLLPSTIQRFMASWSPASPYEASLVEDLASLRVRLNRCIRIETGLLDSELPEITSSDSHESISSALASAFAIQKDAFSVFSRYEATLSRAYDRTLKQLLATRKEKLIPTSRATDLQAPSRLGRVESAEGGETNPPPALNPSIRTEIGTPASPQDTATRRHGAFTPLPERIDPPVQLVWILEDGSEYYPNRPNPHAPGPRTPRG